MAARLMARHKDAMKRTVRFITFPGEETGCFGSAGYVLEHLGEIDKIKFMFNLDGAGRANKPGVMVQGWSDAIPFFKKISVDMSQPMPLGVGFSLYSDHMPFALRGLHTASLRGSSGFTSWRGTREWGHTEADTEDKVDIRDMREAAANLARILTKMAFPMCYPSNANQETKSEQCCKNTAMTRLWRYSEAIHHGSSNSLALGLKLYAFARAHSQRCEGVLSVCSSF